MHRRFCNQLGNQGLSKQACLGCLGHLHARQSAAGVKPSFLISEIGFAMSAGSKRPPRQNSAMFNLNKSEAEALEQLLNGERLWSWPNGRVQLGQSFPDLAIINNLVRQGLLNQAYEPTEAARAALQSWQTSIGLPATTTIRTSDGSPRPRLSGD